MATQTSQREIYRSVASGLMIFLILLGFSTHGLDQDLTPAETVREATLALL